MYIFMLIARDIICLANTFTFYLCIIITVVNSHYTLVSKQANKYIRIEEKLPSTTLYIFTTTRALPILR